MNSGIADKPYPNFFPHPRKIASIKVPTTRLLIREFSVINPVRRNKLLNYRVRTFISRSDKLENPQQETHTHTYTEGPTLSPR